MHLPVELQSLVDIYDQPFVIINHNHRVVVINKAFEETYGVSRTEAAGSPCYSLVAHSNRPCPCGHEGENCPFDDVFQREVTQASTHTYRDADGRDHMVQIQAYPLRASNGDVYLGELIQQDAVRHHPDMDAELRPGARLIGESPAFRKTLGQLKLVAGSDAPVLLQGETGTGKELAAAYIHYHSARRDGHFHTLDCSALTEELFESEVFGHERGAFTGSVGVKRGLFELADQGTLFLDEIGELSLAVQAKLLRVLESGEFRRVGDVKTRSANVRIVCATNRQLRDATWFRSDLYFRVACITVHLPSLVERRSDIPALADELLKRIGKSSGQRFTLDDDAQRLLQDYDYPGNIRELRNILWVAAVNSPGGRISSQEVATALPARVNGSCHASGGPEQGGITHRETASHNAGVEIHQGSPPRPAWEADHLAMVLRRNNGKRRAVAEELGVSERTVYRKLKQFGLN